LDAIRQLAEIRKDDVTVIAVMQRMMEINPGDTRTRFSLAYKHSQAGNEELALFHYLKIPWKSRDSMAWNNLGVSFDRATLPAKSVEAYQKAQAEGETLAMSNLAHKFMKSGFVKEARTLFEDAIARPNCHSNVPRGMAQLEEQKSQEDKELDDILVKTRVVSEFYNEVGRNISVKQPRDIARRWKGAEFELEVTLNGSLFIAKGEYEVSTNNLGLSGWLAQGSRPAAERWQIEYTGSLRGLAILGSVYRGRAGEVTSLLGSLDQTASVLMILSEDGREFRVMEARKDSRPSFYKIERVSG
jgi:hypothetical protein